MKVLLIDIDSTIPNLALKKIEKYHLDRGDEVIWNLPVAKKIADKIYVSCIFTKNKHKCKKWEGIAEIGGTGYDMYKKLPEEIENVKVRMNYGFTTRGCVRKCTFCFVPRKEGKIRIVGDIYDVWDGKSKDLILMDNNILGKPKHFKKICKQIRKEDLRVDFNQGLDVRLLTDDLANEIKKTRMKEIRFAFDSPKEKPLIEKKMKILKKYNIAALWYILVGYDSDFDEELGRVDYLIKHKQRPYIMRHEDCYKDKRYTFLMTWANAPFLGKGCVPFKAILNNHESGKRFRKYFKGTKYYEKPKVLEDPENKNKKKLF